MKGINRLVMAVMMVIGLLVNTVPAQAADPSWGWVVNSPDKTKTAMWQMKETGKADLEIDFMSKDGRSVLARQTWGENVSFASPPVWSPSSKAVTYLVKDYGIRVETVDGLVWGLQNGQGSISEISTIWTKKGVAMILVNQEKNKYWLGTSVLVDSFDSMNNYQGVYYLYSSTSPLSSVTISPNGYYVAVFDPSVNATVVIANDVRGTTAPARYLWGCTKGNWAPGSGRFACMMKNGELKLYDLTNGTEVSVKLPTESLRANSIEWSDDGTKVVWTNGTAVYWNDGATTYRLTTFGVSIYDPHINGRYASWTQRIGNGQYMYMMNNLTDSVKIPIQ